MNLKSYLWMQNNIQDQFNLSPSKRFHLEHILYEKMKTFLFKTHYKSMGFLHIYQDDLDIRPVIDDLLKVNNKAIYYSEIVNHKLKFYRIQTLYEKHNYIHGYMHFLNKENLISNLDLVIIPLQGYYDNYGMLFNSVFYNYLQNFKGVKIGYVNKKYVLANPNLLDSLPTIKLDKIILI